jgi:hypothetical protein
MHRGLTPNAKGPIRVSLPVSILEASLFLQIQDMSDGSVIGHHILFWGQFLTA